MGAGQGRGAAAEAEGDLWLQGGMGHVKSPDQAGVSRGDQEALDPVWALLSVRMMPCVWLQDEEEAIQMEEDKVHLVVQLQQPFDCVQTVLCVQRLAAGAGDLYNAHSKSRMTEGCLQGQGSFLGLVMNLLTKLLWQLYHELLQQTSVLVQSDMDHGSDLPKVLSDERVHQGRCP